MAWCVWASRHIRASRVAFMTRSSVIWRDTLVIGVILCFNWRNVCNRTITRGRIMANRRVGDIAEDLAAVVDFVRQRANGARSREIAEALKDIPQRTLQRWLKSLVGSGRLVQEGKGPAARYRFPGVVEEQKQTAARQAGPEEEKPEEAAAPLSAESAKIREYLRRPFGARKPLATTASFSTAIDPTRLSTSRRMSGRTWRKWARRRPGPKRPEPMRSRFSTACSSTCPGTQAGSKAIPTRCLIPVA
jgi:hypothetical protein